MTPIDVAMNLLNKNVLRSQNEEDRMRQYSSAAPRRPDLVSVVSRGFTNEGSSLPPSYSARLIFLYHDSTSRNRLNSVCHAYPNTVLGHTCGHTYIPSQCVHGIYSCKSITLALILMDGLHSLLSLLPSACSKHPHSTIIQFLHGYV